MFPFMSPMMPMSPMGGMMPGLICNPPTAKQVAEMKRAILQSQQQQLTQLRDQVAQYAKSIEETLSQIGQEMEKQTDEGDDTATMWSPALAASLQVQARAQSQLLDRWRLDYRADWQQMDRQMLADRQLLYQGGMGDFGRPVF
jgi:hypothetical protein